MKNSVLATLFVMSMFFITACSTGGTVGTPAPVDVAPTPLADVLAQPADFDGRTIVLRGILSTQCSSLCDFSFTEKTQSVTIFMGALKPPRINPGQPLRVTTQVHNGEKQVVFTTIGLEILPRAGGDS
jgi:hypothetical protein